MKVPPPLLSPELLMKLSIRSAPNERSVLPIRVVPGASRLSWLGVHDGALKLAITSPPVEGAANTTIRKVFAKLLRVPTSNVQIVRGEKSRNKWLEVPLSEEVLRRHLSA